IKNDETCQHASHGARHSPPRVLSFTSGDSKHLRADEAENNEHQRQPYSAPAIWQEASVGAEVVHPDRPLLMYTEQNRRAQQDEYDDGANFDHGEPVLKLAEGPDAASIHEDEHGRIKHHPDPSRALRKPPPGVNGRG